MTREKQIAILMEDYCTRQEAIKHLNDGALVFNADEIDAYLEEINKEAYDEDDIIVKEHFEQKRDCLSTVWFDDEKYYIMYCL